MFEARRDRLPIPAGGLGFGFFWFRGGLAFHLCFCLDFAHALERAFSSSPSCFLSPASCSPFFSASFPPPVLLPFKRNKSETLIIGDSPSSSPERRDIEDSSGSLGARGAEFAAEDRGPPKADRPASPASPRDTDHIAVGMRSSRVVGHSSFPDEECSSLATEHFSLGSSSAQVASCRGDTTSCTRSPSVSHGHATPSVSCPRCQFPDLSSSHASSASASRRLLHTVDPTTGTSPPCRSSRAAAPASARSPVASLSSRKLGSGGILSLTSPRPAAPLPASCSAGLASGAQSLASGSKASSGRLRGRGAGLGAGRDPKLSPSSRLLHFGRSRSPLLSPSHSNAARSILLPSSVRTTKSRLGRDPLKRGANAASSLPASGALRETRSPVAGRGRGRHGSGLQSSLCSSVRGSRGASYQSSWYTAAGLGSSDGSSAPSSPRRREARSWGDAGEDREDSDGEYLRRPGSSRGEPFAVTGDDKRRARSARRNGGKRDVDEAEGVRWGMREGRGDERDERKAERLERGDRNSRRERETHAAAIAAAAVEGRGDVSLMGESSDSLLTVQRSRFSGVCKWLQHRFYGRGELERLCGEYSPQEVERVVLQSKALSVEDKQRLIFLTRPSAFQDRRCASLWESKASSTSGLSLESCRRSSEASYPSRANGRWGSPRATGSVSKGSTGYPDRENSAGKIRSAVAFGGSRGPREKGGDANQAGVESDRDRDAPRWTRYPACRRGDTSGEDQETPEGWPVDGEDERNAMARPLRKSGNGDPRSARGGRKAREVGGRRQRSCSREEGKREQSRARLVEEELEKETQETERVWGRDNEERAVLEECVEEVQRKKLVRNAGVFRIGFLRNLAALRGVTFAIQHLGSLQRKSVDSTDVRNQEKFSRLWGLLMPNHRLPGRICKEWKELGFQGEDPATDFRGCGELGLDSLVFLASRFPCHARGMLEASRHSTYWYSFAITCINVTSWLCEWVFQRRAHVVSFFFTTHTPEAVELTFHYLFVHVFTRFHAFWFLKKPSSIMEFPFVAGAFKNACVLPSSLPACALVSPRGVCNSDENRNEAWCYAAALKAYQRSSQLPERPAAERGTKRKKGTDRDDSAFAVPQEAPARAGRDIENGRESERNSDGDRERDSEGASEKKGDRGEGMQGRGRAMKTHRIEDEGGRASSSSPEAREPGAASVWRRRRTEGSAGLGGESRRERGREAAKASAKGDRSQERCHMRTEETWNVSERTQAAALSSRRLRATFSRPAGDVRGAPESERVAKSLPSASSKTSTVSPKYVMLRKLRNSSKSQESGPSSSRLLASASTCCFRSGFRVGGRLTYRRCRREEVKGSEGEENAEENIEDETEDEDGGERGCEKDEHVAGPHLGDCPCCRGWVWSLSHVALSLEASSVGGSPRYTRLRQRLSTRKRRDENEDRGGRVGSAFFWRSRSVKHVPSYLQKRGDKEGPKATPSYESNRFKLPGLSATARRAAEKRPPSKQSSASPHFRRLLSSVVRKTEGSSRRANDPARLEARQESEGETRYASAREGTRAVQREQGGSSPSSLSSDGERRDSAWRNEAERQRGDRDGWQAAFAFANDEDGLRRQRETETNSKSRRLYRQLTSTSRSSRNRSPSSRRHDTEDTNEEENEILLSSEHSVGEDRDSVSSGDEEEDARQGLNRRAGASSSDRASSPGRETDDVTPSRGTGGHSVDSLRLSGGCAPYCSFSHGVPLHNDPHPHGLPAPPLSRVLSPPQSLSANPPRGGSAASAASSYFPYPASSGPRESGARDPWGPTSSALAGGRGSGGLYSGPKSGEFAGPKAADCDRASGRKANLSESVTHAEGQSVVGEPSGAQQPLSASLAGGGAPNGSRQTVSPFLHGGRGISSHSQLSSFSSASAATAYFTPVPGPSLPSADPQDDRRSLLSRFASLSTQSVSSSPPVPFFSQAPSTGIAGPGNRSSSSSLASKSRVHLQRHPPEGGTPYLSHSPLLCRGRRAGAPGYASTSQGTVGPTTAGASWETQETPGGDTLKGRIGGPKAKVEMGEPFDLLS
ncbi:At2g44770/F16B22.26, related [Neospora caninum Liverpool]|uniref:At2g44770/F16B22.26, related n=1 Tax=Neospora caninum (strain Liverpool) TaxID=572307 RepID=F0VFP5_NEOCL|nr:At2g44770/F16B22.26, related [Neospora caninum Liverpool]CBZ52539.1 At2g44770/F16B22.26, related [Neospora caninum Liverpool]|eukprot:XP_003882571.1 At2g44770/F16B22.26, related [Neospora caninum Liverpool]